MSILVTGASGFVGKHLIKYLRLHQDQCIGLSRSQSADSNHITCDLTDRKQVDRILKQLKPALIYHMAGSFSNDYETDFNTNVVSTKNLLDSIAEQNLSTRILLMGSAAEYGEVEAGKNPITEEQALRPISIYGWTKAAQSQLASVYFNTHGIETVVARTFNLAGDGASEQLFIGRIKKQINAVLTGKAERISVGNINAIRDYLDINQACEMYRVIATKGHAGETYNVASGKPVTMRDMLKNMLADAGLDTSIVDEKSYTKTSTTIETSVNYASIKKYLNLVNQ
jgi:GDP-4-dehydro-6-deoxy-D-mannose reductase